jgi:hypothetical protein
MKRIKLIYFQGLFLNHHNVAGLSILRLVDQDISTQKSAFQYPVL